ncbi:hypothetical protein ABLE94_07250 [Gordonia sp. VNK1]|jgi:hypothetical protein|uniref:hypothetical protein n=1 Tax=Gordonia oleivorans TaxID=3156618 RepID=UPI0032B5E1F0
MCASAVNVEVSAVNVEAGAVSDVVDAVDVRSDEHVVVDAPQHETRPYDQHR